MESVYRLIASRRTQSPNHNILGWGPLPDGRKGRADTPGLTKTTSRSGTGRKERARV